MIDNIDKVLERGDRLELLVDKTATMQGNTMRFKRQARRFRNTVWWRNVKLTLVTTALIIFDWKFSFPFLNFNKTANGRKSLYISDWYLFSSQPHRVTSRWSKFLSQILISSMELLPD